MMELIKMKEIECFKIKVITFDKMDDFFQVKSGRTLFSIYFDRFSLNGNPTVICADPFLFVHNDRLYLFYERKTLLGKGVIEMVSTSDTAHWTSPIKVLGEDFHLSYPYVFEDNGHVYMIPETCADHSVRLYKAKDESLSEFLYVKKILVQDDYSNLDLDFSDSFVQKIDERYYLMTTTKRNGVNNLELYCSDDLYGPYIPHPFSPIIKSNKYGRNAGCLLQMDRLYRVAQDCETSYGDDVHLIQVDFISNEDYKEHVYNTGLLKKKSKFFREGGHQFNSVIFKEKRIVAVDAKEYHLFVYERIHNKIMRKIGKIC